MGRADSSQTYLLVNYQDDRDREDGSSISSSHSSNQVPLELDEPPAYTSVATRSEAELNHLHTEHSALNAAPNYDDYDILSSKTHKNARGSTTSIFSNSLCSDPKLLRDFVAAQTKLMPNPIVRMIGTHTETRTRDKREETISVTDFDISISASDMLATPWRRTICVENGRKTYRGGRWKTVATNFKADLESTHTAPRPEEWFHRFCASSASLKAFTISRHVINRDDKYLIDALHAILRSTNYRGSISVTFPLEDRETTVMSDHPINRYRTNPFIWWTCVLLQLWIILWPILWLLTKRWEVLYVNWPCRIFEHPDTGWSNADEDFPERVHQGIRPDERNARNYRDFRLAVMSEMAWVEGWRGAIIKAAESRKQGMLYAADRDATRAVEQRNAEREWESRQRATLAAQGRFVNTALGLIRGASDALRDSQMAVGWGGNT